MSTGRGTATFMVAGKECTRGCRFCAVETLREPAAPDAHEPRHLADAIAAMGLSYAVITVVNRDDLPDGGASHYRACLDAVHARMPHVGLELLCSDLAGNEAALAELLDGAPLQVFAHNVETVERLTSEVRDPRASFAQSLRILEAAKELQPGLVSKSSIMLGMGESGTELEEAFRALRDVGVELLTLGQYLAPGSGYHPGSGAVICPALLGFIVAVFGSGTVGSFQLKIDLGTLNQSLLLYVMVLGAAGVWMQAVILQTTRTALLRTPNFMLLASTTLLLALKLPAAFL